MTIIELCNKIRLIGGELIITYDVTTERFDLLLRIADDKKCDASFTTELMLTSPFDVPSTMLDHMFMELFMQQKNRS